MADLHSDKCDKAYERKLRVNGLRAERCCICLVSVPVVTPNVRRTDPATSRAAGAAIIADLSKIQRLVLRVYQDHGKLSARQAEKLSEFDGYGFSTIRKRISELAASEHLTSVGTETDSGRGPATVYEITRA